MAHPVPTQAPGQYPLPFDKPGPFLSWLFFREMFLKFSFVMLPLRRKPYCVPRGKTSINVLFPMEPIILKIPETMVNALYIHPDP